MRSKPTSTAPTSPNALEPLLTITDVAGLLNVSRATMKRWLMVGASPRALKIGAGIRFHPQDVRAFIDSRSAAKGGR